MAGGKSAETPAVSEQALVDGIARGDRSLAAELCRRLTRVVDATIYRVLGGREHDHDDLVQTSFERIVSGLYAGKFSQRASLSTWAAGIACNVALHAIRRRRTERRLFDGSRDVEEASTLVHAQNDPEREAHTRSELQRLRGHLSRMSDKLAETLLLHDMLGCSLTETAEVLGVSEAAAQSRLVRGRRELSERLQRDAETQGGVR
jgi:RNA polymerase sigma-70 factor (ECF subfamily)